MTKVRIHRRLDRLLDTAQAVPITEADRFVIISDLHMGNGGSRDEFRHNAALLRAVLRRFYLDQGFQLVLNGDIEELHKFTQEDIARRWKNVYALFDAFRRGAGLYRLAGNHDADFRTHRRGGDGAPAPESLRLSLRGDDVLIFHGHQASRFAHALDPVARLALRHIARPLRINNYSVAVDNASRYRVEKAVYDFAKDNRVLAVVGHTHRPLFESLSRIDWLKFQIEQLCRAYTTAGEAEREALAHKIRGYKVELEQTFLKDRARGSRSSLYDSEPVVPCLFNSGCVIGKRGMTALEIADGEIRLVHFFDRTRSDKYFGLNGYVPERVGRGNTYRVVLKADDLDYVFTRLKLLS